MSVLSDVLHELEAGADAATVARRLQIPRDLVDAAIDHWVDAGRAVRPAGPMPAVAGATMPVTASATPPCHGCEPRPLWRTALSCHGCPFAAPRPAPRPPRR